MKINEIIISEEEKEFREFQQLQPHITDWKSNGIERWHFIYLNNDPRQCIHIAGFSANFEPRELLFKSTFNALKRKHYSDLLLLVTFYGHMNNQLLVEKINQPKIPVDDLTELLFNESSNGYLAYAHQLEQIYTTMTGATSNEANQFRRDWNKKKESVITQSKGIAYKKNISIHDYITENSFFSEGPFFLSANFRQAKLLYESILN